MPSAPGDRCLPHLPQIVSKQTSTRTRGRAGVRTLMVTAQQRHRTRGVEASTTERALLRQTKIQSGCSLCCGMVHSCSLLLYYIYTRRTISTPLRLSTCGFGLSGGRTSRTSISHCKGFRGVNGVNGAWTKGRIQLATLLALMYSFFTQTLFRHPLNLKITTCVSSLLGEWSSSSEGLGIWMFS